jgi:hypothetical protein
MEIIVKFFAFREWLGENTAFGIIKFHAEVKGYDIDDIKEAWKLIAQDNEEGETAREYLEGVCGTSIEIVLDRGC